MARTEFNVAGISFRVSENPHTATLRPTGTCEIVLDPHNRFAKHPRGAFAVVWQGNNIGFVPDKARDVQDAIIAAMDAGEPYSIEIIGYSYGDGKGGGWNNNGEGVLSSVKCCLCTEGDGNYRRNNGKDYIRISHFVDCFDPDGSTALDMWMVDSFATYSDYLDYMKWTADNGTKMHAALEAFFKEGKMDASALPENLGEFTSRHTIEPISFEERIYDDDLLITGQFDMLARVDGVLTVVDWKSSKRVRAHHKLQACFYSANIGSRSNLPVSAMVVAFGGAPDVWKAGPDSVARGYDIVHDLRNCVNAYAEM